MRIWVVLLVIGAFLWALWSVDPWLALAALAVAFGMALVAVGVMDRRPLKPIRVGDVSVFPEVTKGRILETVKPGLGTIYLRAICIFNGIMFMVLGIGLAVMVFRHGTWFGD